MRSRKIPFQGWVGSADMQFGVTGGDLSNGIPSISHPFNLPGAGGITNDGGGTVADAPSPNDPTGIGAGFAAVDEPWYRSDVDFSGATVFVNDWSAAVWYDLTSTATTGVQTLLELSKDTASHVPFRLFYEPTNNRFGLSWGPVSPERVQYSPAIPARGMISLDARSGNRQIDWFHDGDFLSTASTAATALSGASLTGSGYRFTVGSSVQRGSAGPTPAQYMDGVLGRVGVWRRNLGRSGHLVAYGDCVRPWDENVLMDGDGYRTVERVVVVDDDGTETDLSGLDGQNWLVSSEITTTVDDAATKANIRLTRRRGPKADLSPYNTSAQYAGLLDLRVKIRLDRAIVPTEHQIQGWEWVPRFEGLIDAFDVDVDMIDLSLTDRSAALSDAFVLDPRAYNYASPNKAVEDVLQEIIDDFEPTIRTATPQIVVGYKGESSAPTVYTRGGSLATPTFVPSGSVFRYNDVSSGPVYDALQAVADQIGSTVRYQWHDEWHTDRLVTYTPRRGKTLVAQSVVGVSGTNLVNVVCVEPHGLAISPLVGGLGQVYLLSSASHNFLGSVASVTNPRAFTIQSEIGAVSTTPLSTATLSYNFNDALRPDEVLDIEPLRSQIGSIRNHVVIKHTRYTVPDFAYDLTEVVVDNPSQLLLITTLGDLPDLDPDNSGITFTLDGATGTSTPLNGTYTGVQVSRNQIESTVPTAAAIGTYSTNLPGIKTDFYRYREVVGTSPTSYNRYGLLSMGVYEGTTLAINTDAEAARLADALISDLALPTADWGARVKHNGYELHDVLRFSEDPKGRWSGVFTAAVVGMTEVSSSGECYTTLDLRSSAPSNGVGWASRIAVGTDKPAPLDNYPIKQDADIQPGVRLQDAAKRSRSWSIQRRNVDRREMGRRHDSTWVWLGTEEGFAPTQATLAGKFRSDNFELTHLGDGTAIQPGQRYYAKFADQDLWGNLSEINGIGAASAATIPSFVARFLDETAGAMAVSTGTTALAADAALRFLPDLTLVDDGADPAEFSFDTFGNYSSASGVWTAPCDGAVFTSLELSTGPGTKTSNRVTAQLVVSPGSRLTLRDYSSATFALSASLVACSFADTVYCNSGDSLLWRFTSPDCTIMRSTTACTRFARVTFAQVSQK